MGCGGSTAAPADDTNQLEKSGKYTIDGSGSDTNRETPRGDEPPSPKSLPNASPTITPTNAKRKKRLRGAVAEMYGRVDPVVSALADPDVARNVTTYLNPCQFVEVHPRKPPAGSSSSNSSSGSQDARSTLDLHGICFGGATIQRGPPASPTAGGRTIDIVSDFAPRFSVCLTKEEAVGLSVDVAKHKLIIPDGAGFDPVKILVDRTVKTRYRGCELRHLPGYNRPIASIAISSDEKQYTVCMGRGKPVPVRDNGVGLQMVGGVSAQSSPMMGMGARTTTSNMIVRNESSYSSLHGQLKMERLAKIIRCVDFRTGMTIGLLKQKALEPETTSDMVFANEDQHVVSCTAEGCVFIWNFSRMKLHQQLDVGVEYNPCTKLHQVRISPDERLVAACGEDIDDEGRGVGQVAVWESATAKQINAFTGHSTPVFALGFHPNSKHIISGEKKGAIMLWVARTGEVLQRILGHTQPVRSLWFENEGLLYSADERFIRLWDVAGDFAPVWTKHVDSDSAMSYATPSDEDLAAAAAEAEDEAEDRLEGGPAGPGTPRSPKHLLMQPPASQSRLRQRVVVSLPCGLLLICVSSREVQIVDGASGDVVEKIWTKAPVSCGAGGRTTALLGDVFGNVYCLDFTMQNMLPTYV